MSITSSFILDSRSDVFDPVSVKVWDPCEGWIRNDNNFDPSERWIRNDNNFRSVSDEVITGVVSSETSWLAHANIDWKETAEAHVFKADVPGLKKEEVKVEMEDDRVLHISGERNKESGAKGETWHLVERSSGKFSRRFRLPEKAKLDEMKAAMENGVLTITVPKVEGKKRDVKSIHVTG